MLHGATCCCFFNPFPQSPAKAPLHHRDREYHRGQLVDAAVDRVQRWHDKLTQARREASSRPLSLVTRTFGLVQNAISLSSFAVLLPPSAKALRKLVRLHRPRMNLIIGGKVD